MFAPILLVYSSFQLKARKTASFGVSYFNASSRVLAVKNANFSCSADSAGASSTVSMNSCSA